MRKSFTLILFLLFAVTALAQEKNESILDNLKPVFTGSYATEGYTGFYDLPLPDGSQARAVLAGCDVNQNGLYEILLVNYLGGGQLHLFEIDGDNNFSEIWVSDPIGSSASGAVRDAKVGDLDGNGDMEIIVSVNGTGSADPDVYGLMIYEYSLATESFDAPFHTSLDPAASTNRYLIEGIEVVDVDQDGMEEVLVANNGTGSFDSVYVYSFTGTFDNDAQAVKEFGWGKNATTFALGGSAMSAAYGDMDDDGFLEAIFAIWDHDAILIVEATGPDTYEVQNYIKMDLYNGDAVALDNISVFDMNNDGRDEVYSTLYSGAGSGALMMLKCDTDFASMTQANSVVELAGPGMSGGYGIAVGDPDGNGLNAIYTATYASGNIVVHEYDGAGDYTDPASYTSSLIDGQTGSGSFGLSIPEEDLDGDGLHELVVSYVEPGTVGATVYEYIEQVTSFPYVVDFENEGNLPEGWLNEGAENWEIATSAGYGAAFDHTTGTGYMAYVDDSSPHDTPASLTTPFLDLTGFTTPVIKFYYYIGDGGDEAPLNVDIYDGAQWNDAVATFTMAGDWMEAMVELTPYISDMTKIRFRGIETADYDNDICIDDITVREMPTNTMDWVNLQWPNTADISEGESVNVYTQGWEENVTGNPEPGVGIEVWIGVSSEDTDPATWTNWVPAVFNAPNGNNDEFMAEIGSDLSAGTYYFASRWRIDQGPFVYGGYSESGGGFWDGTTYVSGVLNIGALIVNTFPYTEGFEDGLMPPAGWSNPDGNWTLGTETNSGDYCARVGYSHTGTAQLISPVIELPANYGITFWWKDDDITSVSEEIIDPDKDEKVRKEIELKNGRVAGHDTTYFEISNDAGTTWTTLAILSSASSMSAYVEQYVDLSAYGGSNVLLRWRDETDASWSAYGTGVDDIEISENTAAAPNPATVVNPDDEETDVMLGVTLEWASGGGTPTGYKVYFDTANPPAAMVYDGDMTTYSPMDLDYSTTYYWQVVPYNATGDAQECPVWSFTTMADPTVIPPYSQNFADVFPPDGWNRFVGELQQNSSLTSSTYGWIQDDFGNITDPVNKSARVNIYGAGKYYWLMTPPVDLGVGEANNQLKFDLALTEYGNTNPATLGDDDLFAVVISTDGGATWSSDNILQEWNSTTPISSTGEPVAIDLSGYSGVVMIGFYGESTAANEDNDLFVDNVSIGEAQQGTTIQMDVMADWNMLSVPLHASDMSFSALFPNASSDAYMFEDGYVTDDVLDMATGYWIKFPAAETVSITGTEMSDDIVLNEGWNLIGLYDQAVDPSNVVTDPADIITTSFFGYNDGYYMAEMLQPGHAYWVKASQAGTMSVITPAGKAKGSVDQNVINKEWSKLTVTDANGKIMTLYIAEENVNGYELPPAPPAGIADIRYESGRFVENLSATGQAVQLNNLTYPVKVSVSGTDLTIRDGITGNLFNSTLKDGETVVISKEIPRIEIASKEIPESFDLSQNYPNPFNPSTTIKFSLPQNARVELNVYNMLGEKVQSIMNEMLDAGNYEVNFNASHLSSGVYFYTIQAGDFTAVKKMILMK